jgi:hypothetical protein
MTICKRDAEVKLDIDSTMVRPTVDEMVRRLDRAGYRIVRMWERRSPGGKGWHIGLTLDPTPRTAVEVVALQAILGSDPYREAVTLARARIYASTPKFARSWYNVLYVPCRERQRRTKIGGHHESH